MSEIKKGDEFPTNEGGRVVVVEYGGSRNVLIKHLDGHGYVTVTRCDQLRGGRIRNPYRRTIYGTGFTGVGEYKPTVDGKNTKEYNTWRHMFDRCYDPKYQEVNPTYVGCTVDERWHNFQVFAEWMNEQRRDDDWQLDKDLIKDGNKVYSPETCRFIPRQLNSLLNNSGSTRGDLPQGVSRNGNGYLAKLSMDGRRYNLGTHPTVDQAFHVYKKAKEEYVKRMANTFKDEICPLIFEALMIYEVNYDI